MNAHSECGVDSLPQVLGHDASMLGRLTTRMELDADGNSGALIQDACNVSVGGNENESFERARVCLCVCVCVKRPAHPSVSVLF
jgi:hypothetical protein